MSLPSQNLCKCEQVACSVVVVCFVVANFYTAVVVDCLLLHTLFYTNVVATFFFIR